MPPGSEPPSTQSDSSSSDNKDGGRLRRANGKEGSWGRPRSRHTNGFGQAESHKMNGSEISRKVNNGGSGEPAETWATVRVQLTDAEKRMEKRFRDIRIAIKKCKALCGFDRMPLEQAKQKLSCVAEEQVPTGLVKACCKHIVDGFKKFYVTWEHQFDGLELMNRILTDRAKKHLLAPLIAEKMQYEKHEMVVARKGNSFLRATILNRTEDGKFRVMFTDYGNEEIIELSELLKYPQELSGIPAFACLCTLDAYDPEVLGRLDTISSAYFAELVAHGLLTCTNVRLERFYGQKIYKLKHCQISFRPGSYEELVDVLRVEYENRQKDPQCILGGKMNSLKQQGQIREIPLSDKKPKKVIVSSVTSPSEFYLKVQGTEDIENQMQEFYSGSSNNASEIETLHLTSGRYYMWFDRRTQLWYRVKVTEYPVAGKPWGTAKLWLIDEARYEHGRKDSMLELSDSHCHECRILHAYLVHVEDLRGKDDGDGKALKNFWSPASIQYFSEFCKGKVFHAVIINSKELPSSFEVSRTRGVVLVETDAITSGSVQNAMFIAGMCTATGPCAGRRDLAYLTTEALFRNVVDIKQETFPELDRRVLRKGLDSEIFPKNSTSYDDDIVWRHIHDKIGCIVISNYGTPDNFCIQMYYKRLECDDMVDALKLTVETMKPLSTDKIIPGNVYVGYSSEDSSYDFWGRMAIISVDKENDTARAINIDIGCMLVVKLSELYELQSHFERIPPYCRRAHLDFSAKSFQSERILGPNDDAWTPLAKRLWLRYLTCGDPDRNTMYYAWQIRPEGNDSIVKVEEFGQDLRFDLQKLRWVAGRPRKSGKYAALNKNRQNHLLAQFFSSVGINVAYEMKHNGPECKFETLVTALQKTNHVGYIRREVGKNGG